MSDALQALEQGLAVAAQKGDVQAARAIASEMTRLLKEVNPEVDVKEPAMDRERRMTAESVGPGEATMIGAGRKLDRIGTGFMDLLAQRQPTKNPEEEAAYGALNKAHPIATAGGEALPYMAIPPSVGIIPAAITAGGMEAMEPGTIGERMGRGTIGFGTTAAGGLIGKTAARFIAPVSGKAATESGGAALDAAERIGMKPTLAESTGSPFLARLEDAAARSPGGGGVMADHAATNQVAKNRAAARSIGETADELTPDVFARAARRIGKVFEDIKILPGRVIQIGPDVGAAADEILRKQSKILPHQQDKDLIKIATDAKALSQSKGRIDGETYQLQRSGLSDAAFEASVGTNKNLYGKLLEALDDSADASLRSAGKADLADALKTARPQYANLKLLEKGATAEAGDVSAAKVASTMRTNNPGAFRQGKFVGSDLGDLATVGEGMKPLRAGSPTYERDAATSLLSLLWSYPFAKAATSQAATIYPRTLGRTSGARALSEIANPASRAAVAAALQQSGVLPFLPVGAE